MREVLGRIRENERDEIQALNYKKGTLLTLFRSLALTSQAVNEDLYCRLVSDMTAVQGQMDEWFRKKATEYGWRGGQGLRWMVDFEECEVVLEEVGE